jgi:hypothetical protein
MTAVHTGLENHSRRQYVYRLAHSTLASNICLPELEGADDTPTWRFSVGLKTGESEPSCHWFHQWRRPSGELWLLLGRIGEAYLLRFPDFADFRVYLNQQWISCTPCPDLPSSTLRHLLLDQVFPLAFSAQRQIVMHASAVVTPKGALVFSAASGAGKSTLAAYLSSAGYSMLTDDCLLIETHSDCLTGTALYSGVRLLPDSLNFLWRANSETQRVSHYSEKVRLTRSQEMARFHPCASCPIIRIYLLSPASDTTGHLSITSVSGRDALIALMQSSFVMDALNPTVLRNQFDCLRAAAKQPLFRRISFRHEFEALPELRRAIEIDLQS